MPKPKSIWQSKWILIIPILALLFTFQMLVTFLSSFITTFGIMNVLYIQITLALVCVVIVLLAFKKGGNFKSLLIFFSIFSLLLSLPLFLRGEMFFPKRYVGAYYYIWYQPNSWSTYHPYEPLLGHYSSSNTTVLKQHLQWATEYGIDFFAISIWCETDNLTFNNTKTMFEINKQEGNLIKLCVMAEPRSVEELKVLADQVWNNLIQYDCYLKWYGKPLLMIYTDYIDAFTKWNDNRFVAKFVPNEVPYFWQGVQTYFIGDFISVVPGTEQPYKNLTVPRENGNYYRSQWQFAINWAKANVHRSLVVMITSWNEWWEGTQIEPTLEYESLYLEITKEYADRF